MPTTCSAHRCTNRAKSGSNIHFFRFPLSDAERLKGWLNAIGRIGFVPNAGSRLCSDHFERSDFYDNPGGSYKLTLKNYAIPSVHSTLLPTKLFSNEPQKKNVIPTI
ncbi:unnamed protein product [Macrosiphum euphorbiae]|uniref:THAP-type domain-containing protein n=1 Tax=Macrosiphum euphorbiae TaxID=13131 RepID=A0AAV0Y753_9HEMI|nr:unnamed protein product [Macrosiphum euphorbiae]